MFGKKLALFVAGAERTQYTQSLIDQMTNLEVVYRHTVTLIDRVRCNCQTNKAHRTETTLHAEDDETNERLRYVQGLRDFAAFNAISDPALNAYLKNLADVHEALNKFQDKFYKQVAAFCVKELRRFTEHWYPEIKEALHVLDKKRDAYDLARHKLKKCKAEELGQRGLATKAAQSEFEQQASAVSDLLAKLPEHEMAVTKAFYVYARAESDYTKEVHKLLKGVPSPPIAKTEDTGQSGKVAKTSKTL